MTAVYAPASPASSALDIVLNHPSSALTVSIDDQLVIDRAHSRKAHVVGVPAGPVHVHVATGGRCEAGSTIDRDVLVPPGGIATLALPGPETSLSCAVFDGLYYIGLNIGLLAIAVVGLGAVDGPHAHHVAQVSTMPPVGAK